jgi:GAF domain-containing protein
VVYNREMMLVTDALMDPRFADNPLVVNEPRVRFYAGCPLILADGSCVGTLCLVDSRARSLEGRDVGLLHDLGDLAVQELYRTSVLKSVSLRASL